MGNFDTIYRKIVRQGVLSMLSMGAMWILYDPSKDPSRVYYGTDTRAFSLLIGNSVAMGATDVFYSVFPGSISDVAVGRQTTESIGIYDA